MNHCLCCGSPLYDIHQLCTLCLKQESIERNNALLEKELKRKEERKKKRKKTIQQINNEKNNKNKDNPMGQFCDWAREKLNQRKSKAEFKHIWMSENEDEKWYKDTSESQRAQVFEKAWDMHVMESQIVELVERVNKLENPSK